MVDRSIAVRLRAEVNDFVHEMGRASSSLDDLVKKSGDSAGAANTAFGRMVQSARLQSAEWTRVGGTVAGVGAAWTGLNVLVAKTGISYNTLQQTSRAALRTLLGGAQEANAQMDKLDAFARTSPFSKAVFIQAQQQMLGFGIAAKDVIPYLSAINEAVAATGGSNQDIAELTRIFSQVQAAAKITAVDLMQFGQRGVNAAELIGSQMGKTGAEIRAEITAGSLDAGVALDALAAGMQERFAGASAGIKDTMAGALDRVAAAWRDLSASFMETAVDPNGGGWLVGLTNYLADLLRKLNEMPQASKNVVGAVSAIGGGIALAAGAAMLAIPRFVALIDSLNRLGVDTAGLGAKLGALAGKLNLVVAAYAALRIAADVFVKQTSDIGDMAEALERLGKAGDIASFNLALPQRELAGFAINVDNVSDAFRNLQWYTDNTSWLATPLTRMRQATVELIGITSDQSELTRTFREMDSALSSMSIDKAIQGFSALSAELVANGASVDELARTFPQLFGMISGQLKAASNDWITYDDSARGVLAVLQGDLPDGLVMTADGIMSVAQASAEGAASVDGLGQAVEETKTRAVALLGGLVELEEGLADYIDTVGAAAAGFVDLIGSWDAVIAKNRDVAEATAAATKSSKDSWADFYDGHTVRLSDYLAELDKQIAAQDAWRANMTSLAGRASQGLLDHLAELGPKGAPLVAALAQASDSELAGMEARFAASGAASGRDWAANFDAQQQVFLAVGQKAGAGAMKAAAAEVAAGKSTLGDIVRKYDLKFDVTANTNPALAAAAEARRRIDAMTASIEVKATVRGGGIGIAMPKAYGGLVDYYAHGDVRDRHVAQIAPAGAYRVWAEPETHGEAYIPFRPDTRQRSLEIWRETGRRLGVQGFASGGIAIPTPAATVQQVAGTTVVIEALTVTAPGVRDFQDLTRFLGSIDLAAHGA